MLSEDIIQQLKSDNALLHVQLFDLTELIQIREEELEILRTKAAQVAALQSNLDENIYQLEQMQLFLGDQEREVAGANRRGQRWRMSVNNLLKLPLFFAKWLRSSQPLQNWKANWKLNR